MAKTAPVGARGIDYGEQLRAMYRLLKVRPRSFIKAARWPSIPFGQSSSNPSDRMNSQDIASNPVVTLADLPATAKQRRLVILISIVLVAGAVCAAPFAATPLARLDSFIPTVEGIMFINDFITSILLSVQFLVAPSRAILALASGYFFSALVILVHALSYPGAFSSNGLLGASLQTAPWLYFFWHIGSAAALFAYVVLRNTTPVDKVEFQSPTATLSWSIAIVICLVVALALLTTLGASHLPIIMADMITGARSNAYEISAYLALILATAAFVLLWMRRHSMLDYWVLLVIIALLCELVINLFLNNSRFTLGFYLGRLFSFSTSIFVLSFLLEQTMHLYFNLSRSNRLLERERSNKLMNIEAAAAAIAHELRQPLAAMVANADASLEFLGQVPPDVVRAKEAMNDVVADGHRTGEAMDSVRTLFRNVDEGREQIDMNEICHDVLYAMRGELSAHGISPQFELTPKISPVLGNRAQLQQVIFNLVHNSVEAMVTAKDRSHVLRLITQRDDRGRVVVAVQDTGPGIDPKQIDQMFDAFVTTKLQGTGLGLAICRTIVERHGGELTAFSDGKNGALFQFALPILAI